MLLLEFHLHQSASNFNTNRLKLIINYFISLFGCSSIFMEFSYVFVHLNSIFQSNSGWIEVASDRSYHISTVHTTSMRKSLFPVWMWTTAIVKPWAKPAITHLLNSFQAWSFVGEHWWMWTNGLAICWDTGPWVAWRLLYSEFSWCIVLYSGVQTTAVSFVCLNVPSENNPTQTHTSRQNTQGDFFTYSPTAKKLSDAI